jgi:hypothetical protein
MNLIHPHRPKSPSCQYSKLGSYSPWVFCTCCELIPWPQGGVNHIQKKLTCQVQLEVIQALTQGLWHERNCHFNLGIVWSPKLVQASSNKARATLNFLLLYQGSSPFTHCATSAGCGTITAHVAMSPLESWDTILFLLPHVSTDYIYYFRVKHKDKSMVNLWYLYFFK